MGGSTEQKKETTTSQAQTSHTEAPSWGKSYLTGLAGGDYANALKQNLNSWINPQEGTWQKDALDTAMGKHLGEHNPYTDQLVDRANDRTQQMFAGAGRYGSSADTSALAANASDIYGRELDAQRAAQDRARNLLFTGANSALGMYGNNFNNALNMFSDRSMSSNGSQTAKELQEKNFWQSLWDSMSGVSGIASLFKSKR